MLMVVQYSIELPSKSVVLYMKQKFLSLPELPSILYRKGGRGKKLAQTFIRVIVMEMEVQTKKPQIKSRMIHKKYFLTLFLR